MHRMTFTNALDITRCGINVYSEYRTKQWKKVTCLNCWATRKITNRDTASGSGKIKVRIP